MHILAKLFNEVQIHLLVFFATVTYEWHFHVKGMLPGRHGNGSMKSCRVSNRTKIPTRNKSRPDSNMRLHLNTKRFFFLLCIYRLKLLKGSLIYLVTSHRNITLNNDCSGDEPHSSRNTFLSTAV